MTPGSHIDVECGDTGLSRQYSLCGDPAERGVYEIAVLRDPESRGGSAWVHTLTEGDVVQIRGPRNHFRFDEANSAAVFVAGGIGITPMMAMAACARFAPFATRCITKTRCWLLERYPTPPTAACCCASARLSRVRVTGRCQLDLWS